MSTSIPAAVLVMLGVLLALLGLFAAGSMELIALGLASVFGAGILSLAEARK